METSTVGAPVNVCCKGAKFCSYPAWSSTPFDKQDCMAKAATRFPELAVLVSLLVVSWGLLGGWERTLKAAAQPSVEQISDIPWLSFPICLAYLIPLLVPITTYVVIAHWTGSELFRYS